MGRLFPPAPGVSPLTINARLWLTVVAAVIPFITPI